MRLALLAGLAVALLLVGHGVVFLLGFGGGADNTAERAIFGSLQLAAGSAIAAGLLLSPRKPVLGTALVAAAAAGMSAMWYWFVVITIPIGLALVAIAYLRGRQTAGPRRAGTA